jgi:hypothetical protein
VNKGGLWIITDVFKWSAGAFMLVQQGDKRPLFGLRNAKAVRARLKKSPLGHPLGATSHKP